MRKVLLLAIVAVLPLASTGCASGRRRGGERTRMPTRAECACGKKKECTRKEGERRTDCTCPKNAECTCEKIAE